MLINVVISFAFDALKYNLKLQRYVVSMSWSFYVVEVIFIGLIDMFE